jgi:hypothetical protein
MTPTRYARARPCIYFVIKVSEHVRSSSEYYLLVWYPGIRRNVFESARFTLYNVNSKAEDEPNASGLSRMCLV